MRKDNSADLKIQQQIVNFLYFFVNEVEFQYEEIYCMWVMDQFIAETKSEQLVYQPLVHFTENYLITAFYPLLDTLSFRHYMYTPYGWVGDNCFSESSNSQLSRDPCGPKVSFKNLESQFTYLRLRI